LDPGIRRPTEIHAGDSREVEIMMDGGSWFGGALMMLLFWGGLAAVIVFGVRAFGTSRRSGQIPDADTILEGRFARGEITQEEFEERKRVLRSQAA
jgi:putative membrane protein